MEVVFTNLHPGQAAVFRHPARFKVLAAGRRWGKTTLGVAMCLYAAMGGEWEAGDAEMRLPAVAPEGGAMAGTLGAKPSRRVWWVAPSYPMAAIGWRMIRHYGRRIPGARIREVERMVMLPNGGWAQVKSADHPDSLRGEGLNFICLDEAAFVAESAWAEALRPALSDRVGRALFISTPKGRNWFWRLFASAEEASNGRGSGFGVRGSGTTTDADHDVFTNLEPTTHNHDVCHPAVADTVRWRFPTSSGPHILPDEIESARESLPERIFRQEYLAEFMDDGGGVFRRVRECATRLRHDGPMPGHAYLFGVDWAKQNDWTVIAVLDVSERALVRLERFNRVDYALQTGRLKSLASLFRPRRIVAERNGMGEPLIEQLLREGLPMLPFTTTAASKARAIEALALAFEQKAISIPPDPALLAELEAFEMQRLPSGLMRYAAPEGMHDDCVMALAMAWSGLNELAATRITIV